MGQAIHTAQYGRPSTSLGTPRPQPPWKILRLGPSSSAISSVDFLEPPSSSLITTDIESAVDYTEGFARVFMTASQKGFHCSSHQIGPCLRTWAVIKQGNGSSAVGCHLPTLILIVACEVINFLALSSCASFPGQNR